MLKKARLDQVMQQVKVDNLNVEAYEVLTTPEGLKRDLPLSDRANQVLAESRQTIRNILDGQDHRMFIVVGPCSIHDTEAALEYARRLKSLADEVSDTLYLVMREIGRAHV